MGMISVPVLAVIGYYSVHHVNKVMDWLGIRFGSYYSIYGFKLLEEIRDLLRIKNEKNSINAK